MGREFPLRWHIGIIGLLGLLFAGCGLRDGGRLYGKAAARLDGYALPSERVAVPEAAERYFSGRDVVALPAGGDAFVLLATLRAAQPDFIVAWPGIAWDGVRAQPWFRSHYRLLDEVGAVAQPYDTLRLFVYAPSPFDAGETVPVTQLTDATGFGLRAVRVSHRRLTPGEPLYLTLFWDDGPITVPDAHRLVLRLVPAGETRPLVQVESDMVDGLPSRLIREGDALLSHYTLAVPGDLAPGDYRLLLDVYRRNRAPVVEDLLLETLYRPPAVTLSAPEPDVPVDWRIGDSLLLTGYDAPARVAPGDVLRVALYWHAVDVVPGAYKVFVHLLDAGGNLVAQHDAVPVDWTYPTSQWQPGEYVRDEHVLVLDETVPRGDYTLFVGMYAAETGVRLDVTGAEGQSVPDNRAELRVVKVR